MRKSENVIMVPRRMTKGKELVILTREEYERQVRRSQQIVEALQVIAEGEKAYKTGKTSVVSSLEEALKSNARR